ncbi:hypothetical protein [Bartonella saheliensis]|uniref:hypothetical protein n=1 Tax=Bartonella saheliensis TaxID=1457016 RepID=UPI0011A79454|nr:hypothetical protein [Bartonella saheliensis]
MLSFCEGVEGDERFGVDGFGIMADFGFLLGALSFGLVGGGFEGLLLIFMALFHGMELVFLD